MLFQKYIEAVLIYKPFIICNFIYIYKYTYMYIYIYIYIKRFKYF